MNVVWPNPSINTGWHKVLDRKILVLVVTVGKRERNAVYKTAMKRTL